jgi:hypothetical protein
MVSRLIQSGVRAELSNFTFQTTAPLRSYSRLPSSLIFAIKTAFVGYMVNNTQNRRQFVMQLCTIVWELFISRAAAVWWLQPLSAFATQQRERVAERWGRT